MPLAIIIGFIGWLFLDGAIRGKHPLAGPIEAYGGTPPPPPGSGSQVTVAPAGEGGLAPGEVGSSTLGQMGHNVPRRMFPGSQRDTPARPGPNGGGGSGGSGGVSGGKRQGLAWANHVFNETKRAFPLVTNGGICVCKKISGTDTWSDHSWCNAVDIMCSGAYGMKVYHWLLARKGEFNIAYVCFQDLGGCNAADHMNHCHVSFAPIGGTPPNC